MYEITQKRTLAPKITMMTVKAPLVARKSMPGQFVIVRADADGERIPLTIADSDREAQTISFIFQEVGAGTIRMGQLEVGQTLDGVVGPLGIASHFGDAKRVLCIGGGVGTAVVYPQVKHLHERGVHVEVITGARSKELMILSQELAQNASKVHFCTDDGSYGFHGFVTQKLKELLDAGEKFDLCVVIGPPMMMKAVCDMTRGILKTMVSLNPIMIDGTGMCGGCRVSVGGQVKYACVDGPDFDGHEVDFNSLINRLKGFKEEEAHACQGPFGKGAVHA